MSEAWAWQQILLWLIHSNKLLHPHYEVVHCEYDSLNGVTRNLNTKETYRNDLKNIVIFFFIQGTHFKGKINDFHYRHWMQNFTLFSLTLWYCRGVSSFRSRHSYSRCSQIKMWSKYFNKRSNRWQTSMPIIKGTCRLVKYRYIITQWTCMYMYNDNAKLKTFADILVITYYQTMYQPMTI